MGGPLEDASGTFDRLDSAGSMQSMKSMQSVRVREEDLREPDEDDEVRCHAAPHPLPHVGSSSFSIGR